MTVALSEVLAAIPTFSANERASIVNACKAIAHLSGEPPPHASATTSATAVIDNDSDLLIDALCDYMRDRGIELSSPPMVKRMGAYQSFRKRPNFLGAWLAASGMSRNEKRLFLAQTMPLLHEHLSWGNNAVGMKQMVLNLHKLPAIVDGQLPGYARSGLLRMIIKRGK